jgi:hypothetical protein
VSGTVREALDRLQMAMSEAGYPDARMLITAADSWPRIEPLRPGMRMSEGCAGFFMYGREPGQCLAFFKAVTLVRSAIGWGPMRTCFECWNDANAFYGPGESCPHVEAMA